jgi:hypothetical protein
MQEATIMSFPEFRYEDDLDFMVNFREWYRMHKHEEMVSDGKPYDYDTAIHKFSKMWGHKNPDTAREYL